MAPTPRWWCLARRSPRTHRSRLASLDQVTVGELCEPLERELAELYVDGHLKAHLKRTPPTASPSASDDPALEVEQLARIAVVAVRRLYYSDTPDRDRLEAFASWRPPEGTDTVVFGSSVSSTAMSRSVSSCDGPARVD